jgi:hypothetical protein
MTRKRLASSGIPASSHASSGHQLGEDRTTGSPAPTLSTSTRRDPPTGTSRGATSVRLGSVLTTGSIEPRPSAVDPGRTRAVYEQDAAEARCAARPAPRVRSPCVFDQPTGGVQLFCAERPEALAQTALLAGTTPGGAKHPAATRRANDLQTHAALVLGDLLPNLADTDLRHRGILSQQDRHAVAQPMLDTDSMGEADGRSSR